MNRFNGRIKKSFVTGDEDVIRIELQDENGELVTRINMSVKDFGYFNGGSTFSPCKFDTYDNFNLLGKTKELKHEWIEIEPIIGKENFKNKMLELITPYEVDGWTANNQDIESWNYHNSKNGKYKVSFSRYV